MLPGSEHLIPFASLLITAGLECDVAHRPVHKDLPNLGNVTLARFCVALYGVDRKRTKGSARRRVVEGNAQVGDFGEAKTDWYDQELNALRASHPFQYVVEVKYQVSG